MNEGTMQTEILHFFGKIIGFCCVRVSTASQIVAQEENLSCYFIPLA